MSPLRKGKRRRDSIPYFCNTNIAFDNGMTVDLFEMKAVIDDLAGLDGLSAEHFKFAHSRLSRFNVYACIVYCGSRPFATIYE